MAIMPSNTGPTASTRAAAVTPDDETDLAVATKGLWIGAGGDLKVTMAEDTAAVTFKNVPDGFYLPFSVSRVWATGTAASDIMALWE